MKKWAWIIVGLVWLLGSTATITGGFGVTARNRSYRANRTRMPLAPRDESEYRKLRSGETYSTSDEENLRNGTAQA